MGNGRECRRGVAYQCTNAIGSKMVVGEIEHPLLPRGNDDNGKRRKQARFITPRNTKCRFLGKSDK
jgi:hypothetical protein